MSYWLSEAMHTKSRHNTTPAIIGRQDLQALGVLVPVRFNPVKVMPGRHPLACAGDGMRLLRTRPYIAGEDNPRDIDKYSPPDEPSVVEWENEAQASIMLLADVSASMALPHKAALRNACLLQLTYSMWRAGDRIATTLFDDVLHEQIRAPNLKRQMERRCARLLECFQRLVFHHLEAAALRVHLPLEAVQANRQIRQPCAPATTAVCGHATAAVLEIPNIALELPKFGNGHAAGQACQQRTGRDGRAHRANALHGTPLAPAVRD